jgi:hypothetical protein
MGLGTNVNVGAVVSANVTVTVKLALPVLPWLSVAVHTTVVVPIGNMLPEEGVHVGVSDPSTRSVAVAAPYVTALPLGSVAESETFAGGVTLGGVVSRTVTVMPFETVLASSSVAVHMTDVDPSG